MDLQQSDTVIYEIPVADIYCDSKFNCRGSIAPLDVLDLARSIEKTGLESPIIVQPWTYQPGKKYRIVAGHRRFTATAIVLKQDKIKAIIRPGLSELDARRINLEENLKRKDLNLLQVANAVHPFLHSGLTQDEVAQELGQPKHWVGLCQTILKLPEDIQGEVAAGYLTHEHIKQLGQLNKANKKDAMYAAIRKIKEAKLLGDKKRIEIKKKITKPFSKAVRTRSEIFELMGKIQDNVGNSFATRVLAWCAGEITHFDVHRDLKDFCNEHGVEYNIPTELIEMALGSV